MNNPTLKAHFQNKRATYKVILDIIKKEIFNGYLEEKITGEINIKYLKTQFIMAI